jgi:hypothetical protein
MKQARTLLHAVLYFPQQLRRPCSGIALPVARH